jgi:opacity protein-like surface antigen
MGSLKTLSYAGAVAIVATSALTGPAVAADLMPPPMVAPAPPPMMDAGMTGLYLRGDIGGGALGYNDIELRQGTSVLAAGTGGITLLTKDKSKDDYQFFVGAGIGYQFNSFLRFDATIERRNGSITGGDAWTLNSTVAPPSGLSGINRYRGNITSYVGLVNAYVDLGTWICLTPYIGAGIGFANNRIGGFTDNGLNRATGAGFDNVAFGYGKSASKTNFAWALMAGVGYDVTSKLKLDIGYRYLNMGDAPEMAMWGAAGATGDYVKFKRLDSHDIKIGMRWMLADSTPAPMAMPAGPLIRKY